MKDPVVVERATLDALLAVVAQAANRNERLTTMARDPQVKALHQAAANTLHRLIILTQTECHTLIITEPPSLVPLQPLTTTPSTDYIPDDNDPDGLS